MNARLAASLLPLSIIFHAVPGHAAWTTNGVPVVAIAGKQSNQVVVSDGANGAIVVWQDHRGADFDIYVQRIDATGVARWTTNGVALCTAAGDQYAPQIISDGAGGAIVAWPDHRNGTNDDIYVRRIDASGVAQWTANGVALCTATGDQRGPRIAADGSGGAIIAWSDERSGVDADVYVQRVNAAGAIQYAANGVAMCTATGDQFVGALVPNGAGAAIAVWQDVRNGTDADIYAQRINSIGGMSWAANGVAVSSASGDQDSPAAVSDGAGGVIATWEDFRGGVTYDVYAQRVNSAGSVRWAANGVALCAAAEDQVLPTITSDNVGGAIASWTDSRNSSDSDIYAQRIDGSGVVQWTGNGVALCTASSGQDSPALAPDGQGGVIAAWDDGRNGNPDVYAQRVNAVGAMQWTTDGIAVVNATGQQSFPTLIAIGSGGGAIVAWRDLRSDVNADIYAVRLGPSGTVPTGVGGITPTLSMTVGDNYPNPFSRATTVDVTLRHAAEVNVEIFDAAGRRVRSIDEGRRVAGESELSFDGLDERANILPSGVYFFRVHSGADTITKKMVIER